MNGLGACILISPWFLGSVVSFPFEEPSLDILRFVSGSGSKCSGASSNSPVSVSVSVSVFRSDGSESDSIGARNVLLLLDVVVSNKFGFEVQSMILNTLASCIKGAQGLSTLLARSFVSFRSVRVNHLRVFER